MAVIGSGAVIGPRVAIHPLVYVGPGVEVGEASVLHPRVVLCEGVRLGCRVVVQAGAVIGGDGFGYVFDAGGHRKIPQVGIVVIEDDVDIGANTTIDRAMLGRTITPADTSADARTVVVIAENLWRNRFAADSGVVGSKIVRDAVPRTIVGVIADHLTIGDGRCSVPRRASRKTCLRASGVWARRPCRCCRPSGSSPLRSICPKCPAAFAPPSVASLAGEPTRNRPVAAGGRARSMTAPDVFIHRSGRPKANSPGMSVSGVLDHRSRGDDRRRRRDRSSLRAGGRVEIGDRAKIGHGRSSAASPGPQVQDGTPSGSGSAPTRPSGST